MIKGDLEQQLMGMVLVAGPAGGAVPRRLPDSPPIAGPQAGRSVGGVRWRDWDSYQRGEELHSTSQPPPPLLPNSQQRLARATSQDPAENAFWQRNVVISFSFSFSLKMDLFGPFIIYIK